MIVQQIYKLSKNKKKNGMRTHILMRPVMVIQKQNKNY